MATKSIPHIEQHEIAREELGFMRKVYGLMGLGLIISGSIAMWFASIPGIEGWIAKNLVVFIAIIIAEAFLVMGFASITKKISAPLALLVLVLHSVLIGVIFSAVFVYFAKEQIAKFGKRRYEI